MIGTIIGYQKMAGDTQHFRALRDNSYEACRIARRIAYPMVKGLSIITPVPHGGKDPDGLVDNRPGVAHPVGPELMGKVSTAGMNGDDFSRNRVFGNDVVNHAKNARNGQKDGHPTPTDGGVGPRNPRKLESKKNRKAEKKGLYRVSFEYEEYEEDEDTAVD